MPETRTPILKAAVIGYGVGAKHAAAYHSMDGVELAVMCDLDAGKRTVATAAFPDAKVVSDAAEVLNDSSIDLVSIASYDNAHHPQIVAALSTGKHVFVEKPLCLSREEAVEIRALLKANPELKLSSNFNLRTAPRFIALRKEIATGGLGRVYALEGDYLWGRVYKLKTGWRGKMPFYSIILGAGIHMVDLVCWLSGDFALDSVFAAGNRISTEQAGFEHNDFVIITMQFKSGVIAKVTGNAGSVVPHFHRVAVYGTEGTFLNELGGATRHRSLDPGNPPEPDTREYPGREKGEIICSFVDSILKGCDPIVSSEDVFQGMSVCLAAEESMRTGKPVQVEQI